MKVAMNIERGMHVVIAAGHERVRLRKTRIATWK